MFPLGNCIGDNIEGNLAIHTKVDVMFQLIGIVTLRDYTDLKGSNSLSVLFNMEDKDFFHIKLLFDLCTDLMDARMFCHDEIISLLKGNGNRGADADLAFHANGC